MTSGDAEKPAATLPADKAAMPTLLVAVLVVFAAQQLLTPILAPLSRELGLTETQLGLVLTVSAVALTVTSHLWGRALDAFGRRNVLAAGLGLATLGLAGFAVAAVLGLDGAAGPGATFGLMLVTRSVLFGAGIAAIPVVALATAAATTTTEAERTRAVGLVGAAQGLALVIGPAAGGALSVVSLTLPLYAAPTATAVLTLWVLLRVPRVPVVRPKAPRAADVRPWDRRVLPMLTVGFLLYLSLGLVQIVVGFLLADRLDLDPQATAGAASIALVTAGVVLVLVQGVLVPRLRWTPARLLRVGTPIAVAAYLLLAAAGALWSITLAFGVLALGLGLAIPGYTAAPTLLVGPEQQGSVAGLVSAATGATFIVGPLLGTALYTTRPLAPILTAAGAACLAWLVVWVVRPPKKPIEVPESAP